MEEAKILHCEDSEEFSQVIATIISLHGLHRVVETAVSLKEALDSVDKIKAHRLDANVILLDGNLRGGAVMNHPKVIVSKLRNDLGLDIPVVGLSLNGLKEKGLQVGRDIAADLIKDDVAVNPDLLIDTLNGLPEPRPRFTLADE
jgi:CheY-like chemotaxis protein